MLELDNRISSVLAGACSPHSSELFQLASPGWIEGLALDGDSMTALHYICLSGNYKALQMLIENGLKDLLCTLCSKPSSVENPLILAIESGEFSLVQLLIKEEICNISARSIKGETCLYKAVTFGHCDMVEYFLSSPFLEDFSYTDNKGNNIFHMCSMMYNSDESERMAIMLLNYISNDLSMLYSLNHNGFSPLHLAVIRRNDNAVNAYLSAGVDPNHTVKISPKSIVKALVELEQVDANLRENSGNKNNEYLTGSLEKNPIDTVLESFFITGSPFCPAIEPCKNAIRLANKIARVYGSQKKKMWQEYLGENSGDGMTEEQILQLNEAFEQSPLFSTSHLSSSILKTLHTSYQFLMQSSAYLTPELESIFTKTNVRDVDEYPPSRDDYENGKKKRQSRLQSAAGKPPSSPRSFQRQSVFSPRDTVTGTPTSTRDTLGKPVSGGGVEVGNSNALTHIDTGVASLHLACSINNMHGCYFLLDEGAKVDAKTIFDITPLMNASQGKDVDQLMEILFEKNPNVNLTDIAGNTALHYAAEQISPTAVQQLINKKAFVYAMNKRNLIPSEIIGGITKKKGALLLQFLMEEESSKVDRLLRRCAYCGNPKVAVSCFKCTSMKYCSTNCQRKDWPFHKKNCLNVI